MSSKLIFITGATGFIGATTALKALEAGYRLRISVRKESQIEKLKGVFSEYVDKLEFAVVPDITVPGAFSNHLEGVDYVLHMASPLAGSTKPEEMFPPALDGTLSILRSAKDVPSITKVVITSSIAALEPLAGVPEGGVIREENGWDLSVDKEANFDTGDPMTTSFAVYKASKLLANEASWKFMDEEKPAFELFTIHPSLVYGKNLMQSSAKELEGSTNGFLFGSIMNGVFMDVVRSSVYVGDVADVHIKVLDESVKKSSKYFVTGQRWTWKDLVEVIERDYPGAPHKLTKDDSPLPGQWDTSKVETELGFKFVKPEVMFKEVLDQQLGYFN